MEKITLQFIFILSILVLFVSTHNMHLCIAIKKIHSPMIAIVIDDFGEDRQGVEEMLSIDTPLTCAIMPNLTYSIEDANRAHKKGFEVILHMPMEASNHLPESWYGPTFIRNTDTEEIATKKLEDCAKSIPFAVGMNFHIGTGVSQNKKLMTSIIKKSRQLGLYFLDSHTTLTNACNEAAASTQTNILVRDIFLERPNTPDYTYAKHMLMEACNLAKTQGYAVVIGHVGPVGTHQTARAIKDSIESIESQGVRIVPLSEIANLFSQKA